MDPCTERRYRDALDGLANRLDAAAASLPYTYPILALAAHLRETPASALDDPRAVVAELAEAYAAALLATDDGATTRDLRRAISGAVRATMAVR